MTQAPCEYFEPKTSRTQVLRGEPRILDLPNFNSIDNFGKALFISENFGPTLLAPKLIFIGNFVRTYYSYES